MKRRIIFSALAAAMAFPALAGAELQPRDLTPVTRLEAPAHQPVEIVREGQARAVVYVADPKGRANFDPYNYRHGLAPVPPAFMRLADASVCVLVVEP